jgi:hypothetical protein
MLQKEGLQASKRQWRLRLAVLFSSCMGKSLATRLVSLPITFYGGEFGADAW